MVLALGHRQQKVFPLFFIHSDKTSILVILNFTVLRPLCIYTAHDLKLILIVIFEPFTLGKFLSIVIKVAKIADPPFCMILTTS